MDDSLAPVILPGFPKCNNNLSWCEDHLAVASGEIIHILTARNQIKSPTSNSEYWHVESIRVNHFSEPEWPFVNLATVSDFSLGEEQSDSSVCSLSWSPVAIGLHKRNVLAVLTTNLLLLLWESTGVPGSWRRTCVVNNLIATEQLGSDPDDDNNVLVFQLARGFPPTVGDWQLKIVYTLQVPFEKDSATKRKSLPQSTLRASPITQISLGKWQKVDDAGPDGRLRIVFSFMRGAAGSPCPNLVLSCEANQEGWQFTGHTRDRYSSTNGLSYQPAPEAFEAALAKLKSEFDKQFNLQGHVRIRCWGAAKSTDARVAATCVTLHPSDMIEHSIPSSERCTVLFGRMMATEEDNSTINPQNDPRLELLQWLSANASIESISTDLDRKIVRVAAACVYNAFSDKAGLMGSSRAAAELATSFEVASDADDEVDTRMESGFVPATINEPCEMCNAAMSISQDLRSGRCSQGHTFARCGISFLAIQEPGISKYCSRCGKEFLNIVKLEPRKGPSLSHALFEEFDVCQYCRGKFRG